MAIKVLIQKALFASLTVFWTSFATLRMALTFIRNPRRFLHKKERALPPAVLQTGWNHAFITLSEIKIHYVHAGNPENPLMLFVHGFPEFWYSWRHQLREFQNDYHVVAIDLRGYGGSDKPASVSAYSVQHLSNDIKEVIEGLGYSSCILVAHDWGGAICWRFTIVHPEMVDKLIICNSPHPKAFQIYLSGKIAQLLKSWYMFFFQAPYLPEIYFGAQDFLALEECFTKPPVGCKNPNAMTPEDIEAFKYNFSQPGCLTPPINYYRAAFKNRLGSDKGHSSRMKPPVLIVWGTEDAALEKGMATLSAQQCDNGRVEFVQGASHWVQQDEPQLVNSHIRKFLTNSAKL